MIIKSMSRKTGSFQQLLDYINKGEQRKNTPVFHNLKSDEDHLKLIAEEFEENAQYSPKRKNGVMLYHDILSLPTLPYDKNRASILEDLARKYLALRAPEALVYAKAHLDTDNPHIHFCISGNKIKQKTKNRLSKTDFSRVKRELEKYKNQKYPELTQKKQKQKNKRKTPKLPRGACIKKALAHNVSKVFCTASSLAEALAHLEKREIKPYQRGKQTLYGLIYQGKKYRLSTLGVRELVDGRVKHWETSKQRLSELERIREKKGKTKELTNRIVR